MANPQLFADHRPVHRGRSKALCVVTGCPDCGGPLTEQTVMMGALFIHAGHGADRQTIWSVCPNRECRWSLERVVEEVRPEYRPARLG